MDEWGNDWLRKWGNDRVSGQTTGPILMPFCIRTTYWSRTWLGVFFFKNLKKCGNAAQICIFRVLLHIYLQKYAKLLDRFWCPFAYELHIGLRRASAYLFSKMSKNGNPAHTFAYFAFYTITQKLLNQIWPDFTYSFLDGFLNFLSFQFFQNMATLHKKRIQKTEILLNRDAPGFFSLYAPKAPSKCYRRRRRLAHGAPMMYTVCPKKKHSREATILKARSAII